MELIIIALILGFIAYRFNKQVRQVFKPALTIMIILAAIAYFSANTTLNLLFYRGFLGMGFFVIVMFAGAFDKKSKMSKRLRSVRKEYSILGFVSLLPHFLLNFLASLSGSLPLEVAGFSAAILMIPLFTISFQFIKKRINIKTWFKIQKLAYVIYFLIFLHLMILDTAYIVTYITIFSLYFTLKLFNYPLKNHKFLKSALMTVFIFGLMTVYLIQASGLGFTSSTLYVTANNSSTSTTITSTSYNDGTYTGNGTGINGIPSQVTLTISNGIITNVTVNKTGSSQSYFASAAYKIAKEIMNANSTNVNLVSGATRTSLGIIQAVQDALSQAKK